MRGRFIVGLGIWGFWLLTAACGRSSSHSSVEVAGDSWPVYPGCAQYTTVDLRKWCMRKHLQADLDRKLQQLPDSLWPSVDTLWLSMHLDAQGFFVLDSLYAPEGSVPGRLTAAVDSLVGSLPQTTLPPGGTSVHYRFRLPVVLGRE